MRLRSSLVLSVACALALPAAARAEVTAGCDLNPALATVDGNIEADEYAFTSQGVGAGILGSASLHFDSDDNGNLALAFEASGDACDWGTDNTVVIYIDSIPNEGFDDTTSFDDEGDASRKAISGGTENLVFAPDFGADYAIAIRGDSATLFELVGGGAHIEVKALTRAPSTDFGEACAKELGDFSMADLGSQAGNPIRFVATLVENGAGGFARADQYHGVAAAPALVDGKYTLEPGDRNAFVTHGFATSIGETGFAWIDFSGFAGEGFQNVPEECGQLSSQSWALEGASNRALDFGGNATSDDFARGLSDPDTNNLSGGVHAFEVAPNDRALGAGLSNRTMTPGHFTLRIRNDSSAALTHLAVRYDALGYNNHDRSNIISFSYSSDNTTFTKVPELDFVTPLNKPEEHEPPVEWARAPKSTIITGLSVAPGEYVYLRWTTDDVDGSGQRDKLAIDDIIVRAVGPSCGDGNVDAGEECDEGEANGTTPCGCQNDCTYPGTDVVCGEAGEEACSAAPTCDGAGTCVERFAEDGTFCGESTDLCTGDVDVCEAGQCITKEQLVCDEHGDDPCWTSTCADNACEYVNICTDGGIDEDAGVGDEDAGTQPGDDDAGMMLPDAGVEVDAGDEVPDIESDCSCRAAGAKRGNGPSPIWFGLLGLAFVLRRHRRR